MSETNIAAATPWPVTAVRLVDRVLPASWLGLYLLLPASGWAAVMFESWHDQALFLDTLRSVLEHGRADAIDENIVGPAYIAAAAAIHTVTGLDPDDSLVVLGRASYALAVAGSLVLVRTLLRRLADAPALVTLAAQVVLLAFVFSAGTWYWSDVPWTHFTAAALVVWLYVLRLTLPKALPTAAGLGALVALLALTRSFELVAVAVAWGLALLVAALHRASRKVTLRPAHVLAGVAAALVVTGVVYAGTGKRDLFFLYAGNLDRQAAGVREAEIATTPTFSFGHVPTKLVQLFVDPCFYSLCTISDYAGGRRPLPPNLAEASGAERLWRLPLVVQLPALAFLPLALLAVAGAALVRARRAPPPRQMLEARLVLELVLAASALVLGYTASTLIGASHLRYGLARDYVLAATLTSIVIVTLASAGAWVALRRVCRRMSAESAFVALAIVAAGAVVALVLVARQEGLPRLESRQLGALSYAAACRGRECEVSIDARTPAGRPLSIPEASTLTFGCGDEKPRFTIYVPRPSEGVVLDRACPGARLVAAWPTVMGLPPGTFEHGAVEVENRER